MENLLELQFEPTIHQNEDVIFRANEPAYSAVFSVADQAVVYIEEFNGGWVGVSGYYSMDGEETEFSGSITITDSAQVKCRFNSSGDVRIRFSGNYYYLLYNVALYSASFPTCAKVPDYGEYVKYECQTILTIYLRL